jgi:GWxTD domain-containing protein
MKYLLCCILLTLIFASCESEKEMIDGYAHLKPITPVKLKYSEDLTFDFKIYEENDSTAKIYFDILNENLLSKRDTLDRWTRKAALQIAVRKNSLTKEVYDTQTKNWLNIGNENFIDSISIKIPKREDVFISTIYTDQNKHVYFENQNWWIRKKTFIPEQFILLNLQDKKPTVKHFIKQDSLLIKSEMHNNQTVEIRQFKEHYKPAIAPFSTSNADPDFSKFDTIFSRKFVNNELKMNSKDLITIITKHADNTESLGFFTYSKNEIEIAYLCMTYLCSANEIEKFKDPNQQATAFEEFWMKAAQNDKNKANQLKKEFLRRVEFANKNFSSYKLGALTDLGMIYIVYGEPNKIEKDGFQQNWYYSQQVNEQIRFTFMNDQSIMFPNNFYLERGPNYRSSYYLAVENWRNGFL